MSHMDNYRSHSSQYGEACPDCGAWEDEKEAVFCAAQKSVLVGRHNSDPIPGFEIVVQKPITWAVDADEVCRQICSLEQEAIDAGAEHVLLQNMPATLAAAWRLNEGRGQFRLPWSIIISVPGERPANVEREFAFDAGIDALEAAQAVAFANPRAKVTHASGASFVVSVDPPMPFVFSHVAPLRK